MEEKYKLEHIEELSFELCKPLYTTNRIKVNQSPLIIQVKIRLLLNLFFVSAVYLL